MKYYLAVICLLFVNTIVHSQFVAQYKADECKDYKVSLNGLNLCDNISMDSFNLVLNKSYKDTFAITHLSGGKYNLHSFSVTIFHKLHDGITFYSDGTLNGRILAEFINCKAGDVIYFDNIVFLCT